jgi:hypothetical protein
MPAVMLWSFCNWSRQSIQHIPSVVDPAQQRIRRDVETSRPIGNAQGFPFVLKSDVAAGVFRLLTTCGPLAILFAVSGIIVNPLKRVAYWSFAHISKKLFKRVPLLTDVYATPAISVEKRRIRVVASLPHAFPYRVFAFDFGAAMSFFRSAGSFFMKTTARLGVSSHQVVLEYNKFCPAVTSTCGHVSASATNPHKKCWVNDRKPPKFAVCVHGA